MTPGTSPHRGSLSKRWADALAIVAHAARLGPAGRLDRKIDWPRLARAAAVLHLLALVLIVTMAWQDGIDAGAPADGLPALHLVFLIATGAAAALLSLHPGEWAALAVAKDWSVAASEAGPQLLAQMSHELRTPLNAVIGFSEAMLRELHGPLGHARYQEYAACISESGGRLLRASEDTLAVTATMTALMADRRTVRRERVSAATLLLQAWEAAAAGEPRREVQFAAVDCGSGEIECDRRAAGQALEHLLREAIARTPPDGAVEARGRWGGDAASLEISVVGSFKPTQGPFVPSRKAEFTPGGGVRVVLARSLLEMQGANLSLCTDPAGAWSARVAFPTGQASLPCGATAGGRLRNAPPAA